MTQDIIVKIVVWKSMTFWGFIVVISSNNSISVVLHLLMFILSRDNVNVHLFVISVLKSTVLEPTCPKKERAQIFALSWSLYHDKGYVHSVIWSI